MKTEMAKVAEQQHLAYDSHEKIMWGNYKGYKIAVIEDAANWSYHFNVPLNSMEDFGSSGLNDFIQLLSDEKKRIKSIYYKDYGLKIEMAMSRKAKSNTENLISLLDRIVDFARNYSYVSCCETCGDQSESSVYAINGNTFCGCNECYNNTISNLEDIKSAAKDKKGNLITGIVGALLGALIGAALWVAVYALGYIAAICGIILAVCIIKGYELFGGKLNKAGIALTVVLTIAMVYVSTYAAYGYTVYDTLKETENIDIFDAIRSVRYFIEDYPDIASSFYKDLVMGYIFTAVGTISTFYSAYQHASAKYSAKKLG